MCSCFAICSTDQFGHQHRPTAAVPTALLVSSRFRSATPFAHTHTLGIEQCLCTCFMSSHQLVPLNWTHLTHWTADILVTKTLSASAIIIALPPRQLAIRWWFAVGSLVNGTQCALAASACDGHASHHHHCGALVSSVSLCLVLPCWWRCMRLRNVCVCTATNTLDAVCVCISINQLSISVWLGCFVYYYCCCRVLDHIRTRELWFWQQLQQTPSDLVARVFCTANRCQLGLVTV